MVPVKSARFLKLDIISENTKGNDSSSNSSKPADFNDDEITKTRPLDESNLEDEIWGIP